MKAFELDEFETTLRTRCPDYVGIEAQHLGRFRVRVDAITADAKHVQVVVHLDEDLLPEAWARQVAKHLNAPVLV